MDPLLTPFVGFPKIARLSRNIVITEKLDGANAQIFVNDEGTDFLTGTRTKWVTPTDDYKGFAQWAQANKAELLKLGPGAHFGEWWGSGLGRGYGLKEKRFSLFNVARWSDAVTRPSCCHVVPTLWTGSMDSVSINLTLEGLAQNGSKAAPGFMDPEGIVIFHTASRQLFKKTIKNDESPKGTVE